MASFGFSILVDTSLVADGWSIREFAYSPTQPLRFRSVLLPVSFEMFVDRPSFGGRAFQPLDQPGPPFERGNSATRLIIRVMAYPEGIPTFEALVDTVRNLNQRVTDVEINGVLGKELSVRGGNPSDPIIYSWSHTEELVPRFVFENDGFLYFVNTFESRGNNADSTEVASVLQTLRMTR